jgi:hypothetical protein
MRRAPRKTPKRSAPKKTAPAVRKKPRPVKTRKPRPRLVNTNPGSSHYKRNRAYERHRGFFHKDTKGRWRTPDGRILKGQSIREIDTKKGGPQRVFTNEKAWRFNMRRANQMAARDMVNAARRGGVSLSLKDARRAIEEGFDRGVPRRETAFETVRQAAEDQGVADSMAREFARPRYRRWRPGRSDANRG